VTGEFSLDRFERFTYTRKYEDAARQLISLVSHLDRTYGQLGRIGTSTSEDFPADQRDAHLATRIAAALTALFSDPAFKLSPLGFKQLMLFQRWIATVFGASPFGNADHIIRVMNINTGSNPQQITLNDPEFLKFCLLYSLDSAIPLQPDVLWAKDKRLAASLFVALLSSRLVVTPEAHKKREELLGWFPSRVQELSLDDIPEEILHNVWMHCSYAERADKHEIKRAFNELIRRHLLEKGFEDMPGGTPPKREKPVFLCILEWFTSNHAMYRVHSARIEALKPAYRLVGISLGESSDDASRAIFDEVHVVSRTITTEDKIRRACKYVAEIRPDIIYYPSVGMFLETIYLINLRLAPIQMVTIGHPATTHSAFADYVLLPEDRIGDPDCFSETMVALPKEAAPFRPPAGCPEIAPVIRENPDQVRVAVTAAVMKLNPRFLNVLREIRKRSRISVEFHIFTGFGRGIGKVYVQNLVRRFLPNCSVVYPELAYAAYLERLNRCDMFLDPFPFGNTNGIVDTVRQGLPGICLTGDEVHSHIDEALFRRLALPDWLIAGNIDEYVNAVVRMIENHELRVQLSKELLKTNPDEILFRGRPEYFEDAVSWLVSKHAADGKPAPGQVLYPPRTTAVAAADEEMSFSGDAPASAKGRARKRR
jgi:hypothetical protein